MHVFFLDQPNPLHQMAFQLPLVYTFVDCQELTSVALDKPVYTAHNISTGVSSRNVLCSMPKSPRST